MGETKSVIMDSLHQMEVGLHTLQSLHRLIKENPGQFEINFNYNGGIPSNGVKGRADIFLLNNGEEIRFRNSNIVIRVARVYLDSGRIEIYEDLLKNNPNIHYASGPSGKNVMPYPEFEKICNNAIEKIKYLSKYPNGV